MPILPPYGVSGVYRITCTPSGKFYIGSAVCIRKRWKGHRSDLKLKNHHSRYLQRAWEKHGPDAFTWEVLEECSTETRVKREQFYLDTLRPWHRKIGFNMSKVAGAAGTGRIPSAETRERMRQAQLKLPRAVHQQRVDARRGIKHTDQSKANMSAAQRTRYARSPRGLDSEATRQKKREAHQNISDETRRRISEAGRNRPPRSIETRQKVRDTLIGRRHSEEALQRMRDSKRARDAKKKGDPDM